MSSSKPVLLRFEFDDFEELPSRVDEVIESEVKTDSNGNDWKLQLYPGGCSDSIDTGMIALILINVGESDVTAKFAMIARNSLGYAVRKESDHAFHLFPSRGKKGFGYGYSDTKFMKRDRILDHESQILINGKALHIDVSIEVKPQRDELYHPSTQLVPNMLALLESGEDADVSFCIEGKCIKAHLPVLRANAPLLANLFHDQVREGHDLTSKIVHGRLISRRHSHTFGYNSLFKTSPKHFSIVINDVSVEVFYIVLQYVYGGCSPDAETTIKLANDLIRCAHRFDIFRLKMLIENTLVEMCVIDMKNVVDYLLFAEANDCALLKEYALTYFVLHVEDVLNSKQTKKLQEYPDLMKEVLIAVAKGNKKSARHSPIRMMSVSEMRRELALRGINVNGSKEVLISRLEGSS
jgi:hypothetical protein